MNQQDDWDYYGRKRRAQDEKDLSQIVLAITWLLNGGRKFGGFSLTLLFIPFAMITGNLGLLSEETLALILKTLVAVWALSIVWILVGALYKPLKAVGKAMLALWQITLDLVRR